MYLTDEGGAKREDEISVIATQKEETLSVIVLLHLHVLSLKCARCQITLLV